MRVGTVIGGGDISSDDENNYTKFLIEKRKHSLLYIYHSQKRNRRTHLQDGVQKEQAEGASNWSDLALVDLHCGEGGESRIISAHQ